MASLSAWVLQFVTRQSVKRVLNAERFNLRAVRRAMSTRLTMPAALPRGTRVQMSHDAALPGEWIIPRAVQRTGVILFMHGGGYLAGSPRTHRSCTAWLAHRAGMRLYSLDYRLAPEHPYPAALDDAVRAFRALVASGTAPGQIVLAGDSAGAGLALATMLRLRAERETLPAAAALLCPLTDLTGSGESLVTNAEREALLGLRHRDHAMRCYAGETPLDHPLLSPLFAELRGLPPLLVQASRDEVLWDDARRFVERARAAGVSVEFDAEEGLMHDWQLTVPFTPEARRSVQRLGTWIAARV